MVESMSALARRGLVSSNAVLKATTVQKSKMAKFDGRQKDEGKAHGVGDGIAGTGHINGRATQQDRAKSMPSMGKGNKGGGAVGSAARSKSTQGGRVDAKYVPGRQQIDQFPKKQATIWPASTGVKASKGFTGNTKMKGGPKPKSGGPYGGPSSRAAG